MGKIAALRRSDDGLFAVLVKFGTEISRVCAKLRRKSRCGVNGGYILFDKHAVGVELRYCRGKIAVKARVLHRRDVCDGGISVGILGKLVSGINTVEIVGICEL